MCGGVGGGVCVCVCVCLYILSCTMRLRCTEKRVINAAVINNIIPFLSKFHDRTFPVKCPTSCTSTLTLSFWLTNGGLLQPRMNLKNKRLRYVYLIPRYKHGSPLS